MPQILIYAMTEKIKDSSAEEKILEAARKVFTKKGYAGTRTRDIAEEAGINLALLNYYFRSKEKLFEVVMGEKLNQLFGTILPIIHNDKTTLEEKIASIVSVYIDLLLKEQGLPLFVLSEVRTNPQRFGEKIKAGRMLSESILLKQFQERRPDIHPIQFLFSLLGMTIFPFLSKPVFEATGEVNEEAFRMMVEQRKTLIVKWVLAMLEA